jgi:hypothetical protein
VSPRVTAATPIAEWPVLLTRREVAIVLGRSERAMANACGQGLMWPPPITVNGFYQKPLRWAKGTVERYIAGELPAPKTRRACVMAKLSA